MIDVVAPVPGGCKSYYSAVEEACKICIASEECIELTKLRIENDKSQYSSTDTEPVIPDMTKNLYDNVVQSLTKSFKHDKVLKSRTKNRVTFVVGSNKILMAEIILDRNGVYRVVVRTVKGYEPKYRLLVKSLGNLDSKLEEITEATNG